MSALAKTQRRLASSKVISTNTCKLECERKFTPAKQLSAALKSCKELLQQPEVIIHDKYFDYKDLMFQGIYVRLRSEYTPSNSHSKTQWEAKVRLGGDYANSQFEEVVGAVEVVKAIQAHHRDFNMDVLRKLPVKADITTHREAWKLPATSFYPGEELHQVIDTCHFNHYPSSLKAGLDSTHVVGELEMTRILSLSGDVAKDEARKKEETADMSDALERFMEDCMEHFPQFFAPHPKPVGKLTAYFAWKAKIEEKEKALKEASDIVEGTANDVV